MDERINYPRRAIYHHPAGELPCVIASETSISYRIVIDSHIYAPGLPEPGKRLTVLKVQKLITLLTEGE
jgi:hypothetical protein